MKLGVLFSGGKDSMLALTKAREEHEIACLISIRSKNPDSYMFHVPNIHLTELQAEAMNLPIITQLTNGIKEEELIDLKKALIRARDEFGIKGLVTGAIKSTYQATRVQRVCYELGLWCFNPLWLINQVSLLKNVLSSDFRVIISGVAAYPLTKELLGRELDEELINELINLEKKFLLNPAGEGGEIETTVIDTPLFKKSIDIIEHQVSFNNHSGNFYIRKAGLIDK